ncbi:MAG: helix-turn-helix domain-containing protein [Colwellia sp.]|nr:helix-turn-helix domain-containing protein [Colwellia sp.]MCW8865105.1 helix-turn-helix domain-containing protein [Colwellia sp.]MCW9082918.1 helix-turn-helix domain-containing protein [Colwellia sp.]
MTTNPKTLCVDKIKQLRQENGWSQDLLAKVSGLSLRTIQRVEKEGKASTETQLALAGTFNVSPKELFVISSTPDVNWKRKNIMQTTFGIAVIIGAITMLIILAGEINFYIDYASLLFLVLFMYSATVIAFGPQGLIKSVTGLKYLFSNEISSTPASYHLARILNKQIIFVYGGAFIALLIGSIAIHSSVSESLVFHRAYAVNLLILFYAAIFAEGILRPLVTKLEKADLTN